MFKRIHHIRLKDTIQLFNMSPKYKITYLSVFIFAASLTNCFDPNNNNSSSCIKGFDSIKSYVQAKMKSTRTPSISIAVAQDGNIIWEESFGWANREKQIKSTPKTIYSLASISKPITATAIMILVERGLIDLNKPVNSYLGKSILTVYEGDEADATVARLLHHTAGLPTIWNFYFDGAQINRPPISESIKKYGIIAAPPGTVYEYSNLGYGIAECIIERISGKSFAQFVKSELFEPLGMHRSFIASDKSQYDSIAARYLENKNIAPFFEVMSRGGGGICSSVHDLVRFGMFHLKNHLSDQRAIISDSTIDYMQSCVDPKVPNSPYKLGWDVKEIHGYRVVNHGGGMPGVSSALMLVPSSNLAIAILSNGTYIDLYKIGSRIIRHILPAKKEEKKFGNKNEKQIDTHIQIPSEKLIGRWLGSIRTGAYSIPVCLNIDEAGKVILYLIDEDRTCFPIKPFQYKNGSLTGSFDFSIRTMDALAARHKVYISLRMIDNKLSGYAAAISYRSEVFYLPYYIKLEKDMNEN